MYQDFSQYLQWLQNCIQAHEARIASLEKTVQGLQNEMKQLNEKKMIHVDRIEYKFDQLKVETLEGTLTIGLNPNDLSGIEDFAIQNQAINSPLSPQAQMQRSMKIEDAIYQYLDKELPQIIENEQKNLNLPPNDSIYSFIKNDIVNQIPKRIDHHLKTTHQTDRTMDETSMDEHIIEIVKQEIANGVHLFLSNLPENMKGMNP
ncbi:spore germination protein GerPC [Neobacillus sp. LXY-1]|uniref:spore germination protein GerPC n=1 Tax=Neobacillus sp. LXY-1 TaxID=3379133 RepID=UPI003EE3481F